MKKVFGILAIVVLSTGLFSCEKDTSMDETQALYETLDMNATDGSVVKTDTRD
ncbi:hypothetical protein [Sediminicola arcticus]|jgi:hypothetical protein|uniref:Uncharacterized protein n=1 Tax=Sediminicola arcticus TaxID=1574308 RepID=A0ABV2STA7_9FLAO|tara:strand:+ start:122 stop:280 length:159 start_codon:yes stop_codon:yes gene_type:complete